MGQCVSIVPAKATPRCKVCNTEGPAPWNKMDAKQRATWVWSGETATCRKCVITDRLDKIQYEKERKRYKKAKDELYPKVTEGGQPHLRRLNSGEQWDSSSSFYSAWRPSSTLKRLLSAIRLAQAEDPGSHTGMQRKGTGFVPASEPAALPTQQGDGAPARVPAAHGVGLQGADATEVPDLTPAEVERQRETEHDAAYKRLDALQELGMEEVEEESLWSENNSRALSTTLVTLQEEPEESGEGHGEPAAALGQQLQPPKPTLQRSNASKRGMAL